MLWEFTCLQWVDESFPFFDKNHSHSNGLYRGEESFLPIDKNLWPVPLKLKLIFFTTERAFWLLIKSFNDICKLIIAQIKWRFAFFFKLLLLCIPSCDALVQQPFSTSCTKYQGVQGKIHIFTMDWIRLMWMQKRCLKTYVYQDK